MRRVHIICHPKSGSGQGKQVLNQVLEKLIQINIQHFVYETSDTRSMDMIIKQILNKPQGNYQHYLFIIGGDGTLHDAVTSLTNLGRSIPITYFPAGTGNDFARLWLKDLDVETILHRTLFEPQMVNVPIYRFHHIDSQQVGIILNSMGFGVDALTNLNTQKIVNKLPNWLAMILKKLNLSYILGLLKSLGHIPIFDLRVKADDHISSIDKISIATVVNNPYFGGGIQIDNLVDITKNEMSLIVFHHIDGKAIRKLLPAVLIHHNHEELPYVRRITGQSLQLKSANKVQGQVDGEPFIFDHINVKIERTTYPFYSVHRPEQVQSFLK